MEYISAEEFLKQSMNIQQEIWNWWKPSKGDLFENDLIGGFGVITGEKKLKNGLIPLLTEGQLRQFIEDKTGCFINTVPFKINTRVDLVNVNKDADGFFERELYHLHENHDLLQAYWKVAIEIAKGEADENRRS
ncbi:C15orf41 family protein [Clostridium sp. ZBS12]|uniref:C15orf41 family protein n=1 Tax=Clostridium sp. ZBS12 TaxID=2949972 RepID=UPI002079EB74|nr:C15orf41 family protein [Clostridium sp. ZBS12]